MDIQKFEKAVEKIDKNKYHINRTLGMVDGKFEIVNWSIFKKDLPDIEYFSNNNVAVLSSNLGNALEDIEKLIKEQENETK